MPSPPANYLAFKVGCNGRGQWHVQLMDRRPEVKEPTCSYDTLKQCPPKILNWSLRNKEEQQHLLEFSGCHDFPPGTLPTFQWCLQHDLPLFSYPFIYAYIFAFQLCRCWLLIGYVCLRAMKAHAIEFQYLFLWKSKKYTNRFSRMSYSPNPRKLLWILVFLCYWGILMVNQFSCIELLVWKANNWF